MNKVYGYFLVLHILYFNFVDLNEKVENVKMSVEKAKEAVQCDVTDGISWCKLIICMRDLLSNVQSQIDVSTSPELRPYPARQRFSSLSAWRLSVLQGGWLIGNQAGNGWSLG